LMTARRSVYVCATNREPHATHQYSLWTFLLACVLFTFGAI
jgi:hypothetical protein